MLNSSYRVLMWLGIPVIAAVAVLLPAGDALAQKKKVVNLTDAQIHEAIGTLRQVKVTLENADHDYGGHRADAVRLTKQAIHQLHLTVNRGKEVKAAPKTGAVKGVKGNNEPQALSDAQLAASIPALQNTQASLQNGTNDYAGHRTKAVSDLGAAIDELQKALTYRAAKDANKNP